MQGVATGCAVWGSVFRCGSFRLFSFQMEVKYNFQKWIEVIMVSKSLKNK